MTSQEFMGALNTHGIARIESEVALNLVSYYSANAVNGRVSMVLDIRKDKIVP